MNDYTNKALPFTLKLWKDILTCPFCIAWAKGIVNEEGNRVICQVECPRCGLHWNFGFDKVTSPEKQVQVIRCLDGYAGLFKNLLEGAIDEGISASGDAKEEDE